MTGSASAGSRVRVWIWMLSQALVIRSTMSAMTVGGTRYTRSSATATAARCKRSWGLIIAARAGRSGGTGAARRVVDVTARLPGDFCGDLTVRAGIRLGFESDPETRAEHPHRVRLGVRPGAIEHGGAGEFPEARERPLVRRRAPLGQSGGNGLDDGGELLCRDGAQLASGDAADRDRDRLPAAPFPGPGGDDRPRRKDVMPQCLVMPGPVSAQLVQGTSGASIAAGQSPCQAASIAATSCGAAAASCSALDGRVRCTASREAMISCSAARQLSRARQVGPPALL